MRDEIEIRRAKLIVEVEIPVGGLDAEGHGALGRIRAYLDQALFQATTSDLGMPPRLHSIEIVTDDSGAPALKPQEIPAR